MQESPRQASRALPSRLWSGHLRGLTLLLLLLPATVAAFSASTGLVSADAIGARVNPASATSGDTVSIETFFDADDTGAVDLTTVVSVCVRTASLCQVPATGTAVFGTQGLCFYETAAGSGVFDDGTCGPPNDTDTVEFSFTLTDASVRALDGDTTDDRFMLVLALTVTCGSNITFEVVAVQLGVEAVTRPQVACSPEEGGGGVTGALQSSIALEANPNVVDCGGGESIITGRAFGPDGDEITGLRFNFQVVFDTRVQPQFADGGRLQQLSDNRARLTLFPGAHIATVTATALVPVDPTIENSIATERATAITVRTSCADPDIPPGVAVVVSANPNVVPCGGGETNLTATLRDRTGQIIEGVGFHFATNDGVLLSPTDAFSTDGRAVLRLLPHQLESTVIVSVGTTLGTIQGTVTVKQYCPPSATVPGAVTLTASSTTIGCGGSTFIAARVRDTAGNAVPEDTEVRFIAPSGSFDPPTATTRGGVLNTVYKADPNVAGLVTIQAAGGASFGTIDIRVDCPSASLVSGAGGGGAPPAIRPPSTGTSPSGRIVPPNTGDAGLADDGSRSWPPAAVAMLSLAAVAGAVRRRRSAKR